MHCYWRRVAAAIALGVGTDSAGAQILLPPSSARIHKWEVVSWIINSGAVTLPAILLVEVDNGTGVVVGSPILETYIPGGPATPNSVATVDFGSEGVPLPRSSAGNTTWTIGTPSERPPFALGYTLNVNTFTSGTVEFMLEFSFDFPYDKQFNPSPLYLT